MVATGSLDGRVAVITGSTRSIGRAIAEAFLADGATVVISGRSRDQGQAGPGGAGRRGQGRLPPLRRQQPGGHRGPRRLRRRAFRPARHLGQQRRRHLGLRPRPRAERRGVARRPRPEPQRLLLRHPPRAAEDAGGRLGPRHQHLLGRGQAGQQARDQPLHHQQARHPRPDQGDRLRVRHPGHHLQRHLPRRRRHRPDAGRRSGRGRGRGHLVRGVAGPASPSTPPPSRSPPWSRSRRSPRCSRATPARASPAR